MYIVLPNPQQVIPTKRSSALSTMKCHCLPLFSEFSCIPRGGVQPSMPSNPQVCCRVPPTSRITKSIASQSADLQITQSSNWLRSLRHSLRSRISWLLLAAQTRSSWHLAFRYSDEAPLSCCIVSVVYFSIRRFFLPVHLIKRPAFVVSQLVANKTLERRNTARPTPSTSFRFNF
jgi:hypothetical protein